jgi:hypothetical protein
MNSRSFWNKYTFAVNQTLTFRAGFTETGVKRVPNGWLVKSQSNAQPTDNLLVAGTMDLTDGPDVFHFYTGESNDLLVVPALPNKPVVFRNNKNLKVSAEEKARLFFRIPLTIQLYFQEIKDANRMTELPLQRLSDTWFGEIDSGEPAYSIGSAYYNSFNELESMPWEAVIPVEISNNTAGTLELQRLILRVEDFNLYQTPKHILTSFVNIEFKGHDQAESVSITTKDEIHGLQPEVLAKCRITESKRLLRRSFFFIKNIYQN